MTRSPTEQLSYGAPETHTDTDASTPAATRKQQHIPLPTSRTFLNDILHTISTVPLGSSSANPPVVVAAAATSAAQTHPHHHNGLAPSLPLSHRPLLTTLHAIFPDFMLPALDLLDRSLVTRLVLASASDVPALSASSPRDPGIYIVRSLASTMSNHNRRKRRHRHMGLGGGGGGEGSGAEPSEDLASPKSYVVRVTAWNCTCAAFAVNAFPRDEAAHQSSQDPQDAHAKNRGYFGRGSFGGLSLDGLELAGLPCSGTVPCCKHLLACVLTENWKDALEGRILTRELSRVEMAGLLAAL